MLTSEEKTSVINLRCFAKRVKNTSPDSSRDDRYCIAIRALLGLAVSYIVHLTPPNTPKDARKTHRLCHEAAIIEVFDFHQYESFDLAPSESGFSRSFVF